MSESDPPRRRLSARFGQALLGFVTKGQVSEEVAMETASSPHDFKLMLAAQGQRASGIEQVVGDANGDGTPVVQGG